MSSLNHRAFQSWFDHAVGVASKALEGGTQEGTDVAVHVLRVVEKAVRIHCGHYETACPSRAALQAMVELANEWDDQLEKLVLEYRQGQLPGA